jgi:hypothetical protein
MRISRLDRSSVDEKTAEVFDRVEPTYESISTKARS